MSDDYIGGTDMKNRILCILMALTVVCFSGCGLNDLYEQATLPDKIATEQATTIMNCFKTGETVELKNSFCKAVADTHNLDEEIKEAIQFIDGDIISVGKWYAMSEAGSSWENGKQIECHISPRMKNVETSLNKQYTISFFAYVTYMDDEELVGITRITVRDTETNETYMIGEVV